ncbi:MAG: hypothetical protein U0Y68_10380 [Blastocatellia bacterium]
MGDLVVVFGSLGGSVTIAGSAAASVTEPLLGGNNATNSKQATKQDKNSDASNPLRDRMTKTQIDPGPHLHTSNSSQKAVVKKTTEKDQHNSIGRFGAVQAAELPDTREEILL